MCPIPPFWTPLRHHHVRQLHYLSHLPGASPRSTYRSNHRDSTAFPRPQLHTSAARFSISAATPPACSLLAEHPRRRQSRAQAESPMRRPNSCSDGRPMFSPRWVCRSAGHRPFCAQPATTIQIILAAAPLAGARFIPSQASRTPWDVDPRYPTTHPHATAHEKWTL